MLKHCLAFTFSLFSFSLLANQISAQDVTVREFIPGAPSSVGYLTLENTTASKQILTAVNIEHIGRVEIHNHLHQDGMMRMVKLNELELPQQTVVKFQAGGLHLMLFEPKRPLKQGEQLKVSLEFASGESVKAQAKVVSIAAKHAHHHHH